MDILIRLFKEVLYLGAMACVLVLLLLALKKIFSKALSPKWQYYLWAVLLLRLLLPFQPPSALSIYNIFYAAAESANLPITAVSEPVHNPPPEQESGAGNSIIGGVPAQNETAVGTAAGSLAQNTGYQAASPADAYLNAAAVVWLAGMAALGLYTAVINLAFASSVRRRYAPLRNPRMEHILDNCRNALNIRHPIPLLTTDKARTPALYGLFRPKILVCQSSVVALSDEELRHVFLHELSHYKCKDIAVNWLLTLLQIVYFFNPLVWYAFYKIRGDGELACDAAAMAHLQPGERQAYGGTILKLVRLFSKSGFIPVTAGITNNNSNIKRRILMIGNYTKSRWTGTLLAVVLIAAVALTGLTGCSETAGTATLDNTPTDTVSGNPADTASPDASAPPSLIVVTRPQDDTTSQSPANEPYPSLDPKPSSDPGVSPYPSMEPQPSSGPSTSSEPRPSAGVDRVFEGQWVVSKVLAYGNAGTYSADNAEKLIGITLRFSEDEATLINDDPSASPATYKNPDYQEGTITSGDFLAEFRMRFDMLVITSDFVAKVKVTAPDTGGCTLLLRDDGNLVLIAGGTFFELTPAN